MPTLDNSSLADRLAALFQCGQPVSENDAIALIGELLASWQTSGVPATILSGAEIIGQVAIDQTTPGVTNGVEVNAPIPAGTEIIGKIGIDQTTPGVTNGVEVNAALPAGNNIIGNVKIDQTTPGVTNGVQVNAALPAGTNSLGGTKDNGPHWTPVRTYTAISTATTMDITVVPTSGQKIVLDDCLISCDAACAVSIVEETSGTVFAKVFVPANGTVPITLRDGLKAAVADKKLRAITSAAVNTSITACYHSEA